MMTLRQIRHFIAVAETGSISAATRVINSCVRHT
jgi:DNA-binding transcriptional LysR family regulator